MTPKYTTDLSEVFFENLKGCARRLGCNTVYDLAGPMFYESGMKAGAGNHAGSGAVGLIQFMPPTLAGMFKGTPTQFAAMTAEDQLPYVERFLGNNKPLPTVAHVYAAIFMPADVKFAGDPTHVLTAKNGHRGWAFSQNANLDANGDLKITMHELGLAVNRGINAGWDRWQEIFTRLAVPQTPDWMQLQRPVAPPTPREIDLRTTRGIQQALVALGSSLKVDGARGPETDWAIKEFQKSEGLTPDGIPGPKTKNALRAHLLALG